MKISVTIKINSKKAALFTVKILGDFDQATDAIAECQTVSDLQAVQSMGLIEIV